MNKKEKITEIQKVLEEKGYNKYTTLSIKYGSIYLEIDKLYNITFEIVEKIIRHTELEYSTIIKVIKEETKNFIKNIENSYLLAFKTLIDDNVIINSNNKDIIFFLLKVQAQFIYITTLKEGMEIAKNEGGF